MSLFKKRPSEAPVQHYPAEDYEPVIRSSICTGEKVACMRERAGGKLHELMLVRDQEDLDRFCRLYAVRREDIRTIY